VIAEGLRCEQTIVSKIMTRNPVYVTSDTLAIDALQKMVQGISDIPLSYCILPSAIVCLAQIPQIN